MMPAAQTTYNFRASRRVQQLSPLRGATDKLINQELPIPVSALAQFQQVKGGLMPLPPRPLISNFPHHL